MLYKPCKQRRQQKLYVCNLALCSLLVQTVNSTIMNSSRWYHLHFIEFNQNNSCNPAAIDQEIK